MPSEVSSNRPWALTLMALGCLEIFNLLLWVALNYSSRWLMGNGAITMADYSLMMVVGTYPILLLSPLITKWCFRRCSLLPLYLVNLAQMGMVTWRVIH